MRRGLIAVAGVVAAGALAAAPTAGATPPVIERVGFPDEFQVACADFDQIVKAWIDLTVKIHFDRHGNPVRVTAQLRIDGTVENSVSGKTIRLHHYWSETYDVLADQLTVTGIPVGAWASPGGPVLYTIGRQVFAGSDPTPATLLSSVGRDNFSFDFGKFCDALA